MNKKRFALSITPKERLREAHGFAALNTTLESLLLGRGARWRMEIFSVLTEMMKLKELNLS
jgi:hypothetical protein